MINRWSQLQDTNAAHTGLESSLKYSSTSQHDNETYHDDGGAEIIIIAALSARTIQIRNTTFYVERMNFEKKTEE